MADDGPLGWYFQIPVVSRTYITAALLITGACFLEIVSPLTLYYNSDLIFQKGQYWRVVTSFLFFGTFSLDLIFHLYFVMRYALLLEEGLFRGRTADFVYMLMFGGALLLILTSVISSFSRIRFLGHPLAFMMVYLWSRDPENAHVRMSFLLLQFNAPLLPWVMLGFSLLLGNPVETDLLGIIVGHAYYFLDYVYPQVAEKRGWSWKRILVTPYLLEYILCSDNMFAFLNTRIAEPATQDRVDGIEIRDGAAIVDHPHQD